MADRRCFHKKIVESDPFYSLPEGAQSLYVHLCMNADDDGFVNNAGSIVTRLKSGQSKLNKLVEQRFVLKFGEVYVIKHWRVGNSLKNDRTKPPTYPGIAEKLWVKPNRSYTDHPGPGYKNLLEVKLGNPLDSNRNPSGIHLESQQNRTELNRTELNRTELNRSAECGEWFMVLWTEYPEMRRGNVTQARVAFDKAIDSFEDAQLAMDSLTAWKDTKQWGKENGQYVPYMNNWFDRDLWRVIPEADEKLDGQNREPDSDEIAAIRRLMEGDNQC